MKFKITKQINTGPKQNIFQVESKQGCKFEINLSKHQATIFGNKEDVIKLFNLEGALNDKERNNS